MQPSFILLSAHPPRRQVSFQHLARRILIVIWPRDFLYRGENEMWRVIKRRRRTEITKLLPLVFGGNGATFPGLKDCHPVASGRWCFLTFGIRLQKLVFCFSVMAVLE